MSRAAAAFALLTAALSAVVAGDSLWVALRPGVMSFVLLVFTVLLATGSGRALAGRLGLCDISESQKTLVGATLGMGLLALGGFTLGALGLYKPWAASALLAGLWVLGYTQLRPALQSLVPDWRPAEHRLSVAAAALPLLAALWLCLVPPHQYDSLVYHLALPQAYLREGRLFAAPGLVYTHFPQNGEMLFTLALLLGSDLLAQMFMWLSTALSIWWVFVLARREAPISAVIIAALFIGTHAAVLLMSSTTYVEPLVMLWVTAAALSFERWRRLAPEGGAPRGWLALSAAFTGLALGTKYYAGIGAAVFGLRLLFSLGRRDAVGKRLVDLALFVGIVTALFAPWLIKNWICVRNPIFPFLYRWFENTGTGWNAELASGYFRVLTEYGHARGFFQSLMSLPILLVHNPLRFGGGMDVLGDLGWDLTLWLLPLGAWAASKNKALRGLLLFCALWCAAWFSSAVVLRFLTPLVPLLSLLGAYGLIVLWNGLNRWARIVVGASLGVMTAAHLFVFVFVHATFESGSTAFGLETREDFLSRRLDYYPCAAWLRGRAERNDKILVVGEQRGYYLAVDHIPSTVHMPNLFVRRANEAGSTAELLRALRADGLTRVLIVPREAARLGGGLGSFTLRGASNWAGLEKALKIEYAGRACVVGRL